VDAAVVYCSQPAKNTVKTMNKYDVASTSQSKTDICPYFVTQSVYPTRAVLASWPPANLASDVSVSLSSWLVSLQLFLSTSRSLSIQKTSLLFAYCSLE